jgi:hypothetical protein
VKIKLGKPDAKPDLPAHTRGVHEGNEGPPAREDIHPSAERSTGVNPKAHNPIDPSMPPLFPA